MSQRCQSLAKTAARYALAESLSPGLGHVVNQRRNTSPTLNAIVTDAAHRIRRLASGKPQRPRARLAGRKIHAGVDAHEKITQVLDSGKPGMIARLGTTESAIVEYYIKNQVDGTCSFPDALSRAILTLSGFFPAQDDLLCRFAQESLANLGDADLMGVRVKPSDWGFWPLEKHLVGRYAPQSGLIRLAELMPIGDSDSWTRSLEGKRVLVIHPFSQTIEKQYAHRTKLFHDPNFLPEFDLQVMTAVQSVGENSQTLEHSTWFEALDHMKAELSNRSFDVALIGAGAYGLFLAAECKKMGAIGVHIGGALQLLFGIKGDRWTNPTTADSQAVLPHVNEHWVSPSSSERPLGADKVEDGCYW